MTAAETPTPAIDAIHAATALLVDTLELHRGRLRLEPIG